jgi:hypothetical protein
MAKKGEKKQGDAVKSYTLVMSLLVVVMGVLYFVLDGDRRAYAEANARLERDMSVQSGDGPPRSFPDLAYAVEQLSRKFFEATGGSGRGLQIPLETMGGAAASVNLRAKTTGSEQEDKSADYVTVSRKFEYVQQSGSDPAIWQLLGLLYNIESRGRYRVRDLSWRMAEVTEDVEPPFDMIKPPSITVAIRGPKAAAR